MFSYFMTIFAVLYRIELMFFIVRLVKSLIGGKTMRDLLFLRNLKNNINNKSRTWLQN